MNIQFKDVAHLYLGCKCEYVCEKIWTDPDKPLYHYLVGIRINSFYTTVYNMRSDMGIDMEYTDDYHKPILRPLLSIKDHEINEWVRLGAMGDVINCDVSNESVTWKERYKLTGRWFRKQQYLSNSKPAQTMYLLSQHFDLFGLIESGQAIDATTLNPNPYQP